MDDPEKLLEEAMKVVHREAFQMKRCLVRGGDERGERDDVKKAGGERRRRRRRENARNARLL